MTALFAEWLYQQAREAPGVDYDAIALAEAESHAICAGRSCFGCWREASCCAAPQTTPQTACQNSREDPK